MRSCILLLVVAPLCLAAGAAGERAVKKDLAKFQGSWQAVAVINMDGKSAPVADVERTRLMVEGTKFALMDEDKVTIRGAFVIDPAKTPKTIDVVLEGADPKDKMLGIYRIDGDIRRSCFAMPGQARPKDFPSDGKGYIQFVWKAR